MVLLPRLSNGGPPLGTKLLEPCCPQPTGRKLNLYRVFILLLTFLSYTCYHMSRKPISVVKTKLLNCTSLNGSEITSNEDSICISFISEINGTRENQAKRLEGILDSSYLFSYAFFMFISGIVAERVDLRYFLSAGMILSGVFTMLFGFAYYWGIHSIAWFIFVQILGGACQSTGWPGVVTVVANWFGKGKKGLIFGIWNSHTSIGNILGSLLAGMFVEESWGLSFIVPGVIMSAVGVFFFFFLIPKPEHVGLDVNDYTADTVEDWVSDIRSSSALRASAGAEATPLLHDTEGDLLDEGIEEASSDEEKKSGDHRSNNPVDAEREKRRSSSSPSVIYGGPSSSRQAPASLVVDAQVDATEPHEEEEHAISFLGALKIPGVVEFALCLFFAKLVCYTFLYWLPTFIIEAGIDVSAENAAYLSTLFDVGGIVGGILAGVISDVSGKSASTCAVMLVLAIPMLFGYESYITSCPLNWAEKGECYAGNIGLLMLLGLLVNGPYALITTAVSAELGTHPCLRGSAKALATVTSIIDGTGSVGAALGPFLAGAIPFNMVFYMLMLSDIIALLLLTRLVKRDIDKALEHWRQRRRNHVYHRQS